MNTTGHTDLLRPHLTTIERLANTYRNGGKVFWNRALKAEPELCNVLLLGEGTRKDQIKRLSMFWMRVKPKAPAAPALNGGVQQRMFRGEQSICSRLDDHRDELEKMARSNTNHQGRVAWVAGLTANPDVADAVGYTALDAEGQRRMINVLGFWYRTRRKPGEPVKQARVKALEPVPELPAPAPAPAARFCPRCGNDLGAHALAAGIVASMSASGLTPEQIVQTLTHAANTVTKLSQ